MFNKNVISVLSQVNAITNSIVLKYPTTVALSESQDIMMKVNMNEFDSEDFGEIGLKDNLSEFLSLFRLFPDEREVSVVGNEVIVKSDTISSSYIVDTVALMDAYNKSPEQFDRTEAMPSVATFELLTNDMKSIKDASGVFKDLSEVIFTAQDGDIKVSLGSTNKFNAKSNTFNLSKRGSVSKEFSIKIPVENFKILPVSDYKFDVKYNSSRDSYRIFLTNSNTDAIKIMLTVKV